MNIQQTNIYIQYLSIENIRQALNSDIIITCSTIFFVALWHKEKKGGVGASEGYLILIRLDNQICKTDIYIKIQKKMLKHCTDLLQYKKQET